MVSVTAAARLGVMKPDIMCSPPSAEAPAVEEDAEGSVLEVDGVDGTEGVDGCGVELLVVGS